MWSAQARSAELADPARRAPPRAFAATPRAGTAWQRLAMGGRQSMSDEASSSLACTACNEAAGTVVQRQAISTAAMARSAESASSGGGPFAEGPFGGEPGGGGLQGGFTPATPAPAALPSPESCPPPAAMDCLPTLHAPAAVTNTVGFGTGSAQLGRREIAEVDAAVSAWRSAGGGLLRIDGYASAEGDCSENWLLFFAMFLPFAGLTTAAGLIEQSRANSRQGFPVGAAYQRNASALIRSDVLPGLDSIATATAARTGDEVDRGARAQLVLWGPALVALGFIWAASVWLTRRTRRVVNVGLAIAALAVLGFTGFASSVLASSTSDARSTLDGSYAGATAFAQSRTAAFDARSNEALTLIARGNGAVFETRWQEQAAQVAARLTDAAKADSVNGQNAIDGFRSYGSEHVQVRELDDAGEAIAVAKRVEHGYGHTATMWSTNIDNLSRMARAINTSACSICWAAIMRIVCLPSPERKAFTRSNCGATGARSRSSSEATSSSLGGGCMPAIIMSTRIDSRLSPRSAMALVQYWHMPTPWPKPRPVSTTLEPFCATPKNVDLTFSAPSAVRNLSARIVFVPVAVAMRSVFTRFDELRSATLILLTPRIARRRPISLIGIFTCHLYTGAVVQ